MWRNLPELLPKDLSRCGTFHYSGQNFREWVRGEQRGYKQLLNVRILNIGCSEFYFLKPKIKQLNIYLHGSQVVLKVFDQLLVGFFSELKKL